MLVIAMLDKVATKKLKLPGQPCGPRVETLMPNVLLRQTEAAKVLTNCFRQQIQQHKCLKFIQKVGCMPSILDF